MSNPRRLLRALLTLLTGTALWFPLTVASSQAAQAACAELTVPIHQLVNPTVGSNLLTPWADEAAAAAGYGFTQDLGTPFLAADTAANGLIDVRRLYRAASNDFAWALLGSEQHTDLTERGYKDEGKDFYAASGTLGGCAAPVWSMTKGTHHRYTLSAGQASLQAAGWASDGIAFHLAPAQPAPPTEPPPGQGPGPGVDNVFSFAVMPDTQDESYNGEQRMAKRVSWLVDNKVRDDLRWVLHSGDVHSWDTPDHAQYVNQSNALKPLAGGDLPFMAAVGNHDTGAVCPGGSACPGTDASVTIRDTTTWNAFYPVSRFGYEGVFQAGKSDNGFRTFAAGGRQWMILTLELWPRTEVINWARNVVATHPNHNVILLTHAFLEGNGSLSTSQGGYGANSPAKLWAALDDYPNVVMSFSGHTGTAGSQSLSGVDGHRMAAFLQTLHDPTKNPVRIVTIDTAAGTIKTHIRANFDSGLGSGGQEVDYTYSSYTTTVSGMRWVG